MSFQAAPTFTTDLTRATLDAAVRSELGLLPPSSLPAGVAAALGVADAIAAIELLTRRGPRRPRVSLGGVLLDCASEGDALALDRVSWVAGEAAAYLRVAARESGLGEPTPIALAGGVMRHPSSLLVDALAAALPGCELVRARREPAHAALLAALDEGGAAPVSLDDRCFRPISSPRPACPDEHSRENHPSDGRVAADMPCVTWTFARTRRGTRRGGGRRVRRDRDAQTPASTSTRFSARPRVMRRRSRPR